MIRKGTAIWHIFSHYNNSVTLILGVAGSRRYYTNRKIVSINQTLQCWWFCVTGIHSYSSNNRRRIWCNNLVGMLTIMWKLPWYSYLVIILRKPILVQLDSKCFGREKRASKWKSLNCRCVWGRGWKRWLSDDEKYCV